MDAYWWAEYCIAKLDGAMEDMAWTTAPCQALRRASGSAELPNDEKEDGVNCQVAMVPLARTVWEEEDVAGTAIVKASMVPKRLAIISTMPKLICGRLKYGESQADC